MPLSPDLTEVLGEAIESRLLDVHTALPGTVKSYNVVKQTAEIIPQIRAAAPKADGATVAETIPVIPNVPVQWPRGGGCALHFPLAAGDHVLLVFSEAAMGHWRETGELSDPGDLNRHSLGYPVAIPGIAPNAGPIADPGNSNEVVLSVGGSTFRVGGASAQMVALANLVQQALDKIQAKFDAHTHLVNTTGTAAAQAGTAAAVLPAQAIATLGPVAAAKLKAE